MQHIRLSNIIMPSPLLNGAVLLCAAISLSACSSAPAMFGPATTASLGQMDVKQDGQMDVKQDGTPPATGAIVPPRGENDVVDLPHSGAPATPSMEDRTAAQGEQTSELDDEDLSPEERHRRELINRGDLEEGQPLPPQ